MMRLLYQDDGSRYKFTSDSCSDIPPYAILSHTWGTDEIKFADIIESEGEGTWQNRAAYRKIKFCADQARQHGLQHFWIDTCCVDKLAYVELQNAINSMFRWYRDASRCYVYLDDVSKQESPMPHTKREAAPWEIAFRNSRWFTRGWTLQELLAPKKVDFYSREGIWIGDKQSLESLICDITHIPARALRGTPLCKFSLSERESWIRNRRTKYEEDMAYSLLGIFDVYLPLIYGEGKTNAMRRLREEIEKTKFQKGEIVPRRIRNNMLERSPCISCRQHSSAVSGPYEKYVCTSRERELKEIHRILAPSDTHRVVVLHGRGGVGKTHVAMSYAKRYQNHYDDVFFVNMKNTASIQQSFTNVARQIIRRNPGSNYLGSLNLQHEHQDVVEAVKMWFSLPGNTNWLLIFDNYGNACSNSHADDLDMDIRNHIPLANRGSIIITTRIPKINIGYSISINKLESIGEAVEILSVTSGREDLQDGEFSPAYWAILIVIKDKYVACLLERLGKFPLAISTAGSYLRHNSITIAEYLLLLEKRLSSSVSRLDSHQDRALHAVWNLSYEKVQIQSPVAAHLLQLYAYFDNDDLWFELVRSCAQQKGLAWVYELDDELTFNMAMDTLHAYRLVELQTSNSWLTDSNTYRIHNSLHDWIAQTLLSNADGRLSPLALKCIAANITTQNNFDSWLLQRRLLSHAIRAYASLREDNDDLNWALHRIGVLYAYHDRQKEAEAIFMRVIQGYEKILGPDHAETFDVVNSLGVLYANQGKVQEAECMYNRALRGYEAAWGPDHTETLRMVYNLGLLYTNQGLLGKALGMFGRALRGYERAMGHVQAMNSCPAIRATWNLQPLLSGQNQPAEIRKYCQRAYDYVQALTGPACEDFQSFKDTLLELDQPRSGKSICYTRFLVAKC
ncbi:hypothetical protein PFICI_03300 [Pestalotiopsis fici W106-1]|uniref:Uncharacterized protein n=1 Tax=Pestalotiopsis fici (strain W106-1 / CGMCC3.15140) TaxID=1229662 RepID=W3XGX5_PESFW|nr:uncharacterized protein PFICI_03300 [Pestalotiopsis fici W106-1]ETS85275.1 hypothetical protein PFICI_03300 [Pestalotiopsis fici W106-1]